MRRLHYHLVDVFTDRAFGGNPLAVCTNGRGLTTETMQSVAKEVNLSETTFVFPSESATSRVRIFTPTFEMSFAGHPTLGSAHVVREGEGLGDDGTDRKREYAVIAVGGRYRPAALLGDPLQLQPLVFSRLGIG